MQVLSGAGMVAAKLAAFWDRGRADPLMSHDLEDLAMLLACCSTLESDLAAEAGSLVERVRRGLADILADRFVLEVLEGSVPCGVVSTTVLDRIQLLGGGSGG